jgi:8-oxo-dGTP diphosphatase
MLTKGQEQYLRRIPEDKVAHVVPFDPRTQSTAKEVMVEVDSLLPGAEIIYIGSSKLGIAGENDIDLTIVGGNHFDSYYKILKNYYGATSEEWLKDYYAKWEFVRNNFPVELHLIGQVTKDFQDQLDTQKILEGNADLRTEYEKLKLECNGLPWKEYLRRKYEFWNRILANKIKNKFWVGVILYNPNTDQVLLQKRDNKAPMNPNKWCFFGGDGKTGESLNDCLVRELKEEINITISPEKLVPLRDYLNKKNMTWRYVYTMQFDTPKSQMILNEGADFDWVSFDKALKLDLTENTRSDLEFFLKSYKP